MRKESLSRLFIKLLPWLAIPLLAACQQDNKANVSTRALIEYCSDPAHAQTCVYEEYDQVQMTTYKLPHAALLFFNDSFIIDGSQLWFPDENGNCAFYDPYDPSNYKIIPTSDYGVFVRAIVDANGDTIADPALTEITGDGTPRPTSLPPEEGFSGIDYIPEILCGHNFTTAAQ